MVMAIVAVDSDNVMLQRRSSLKYEWQPTMGFGYSIGIKTMALSSAPEYGLVVREGMREFMR